MVLYVPLFQHTSVLVDAAILNLTNQFDATCELSKVTLDGFVVSLFMSPDKYRFFHAFISFQETGTSCFCYVLVYSTSYIVIRNVP